MPYSTITSDDAHSLLYISTNDHWVLKLQSAKNSRHEVRKWEGRGKGAAVMNNN